MASRYKELLLKIARKITREELEEMKFLSDEFLPDIKPESVLVREIFMFFRGLENAKLLGENNLDWLEYLLGTVKRTDLVFMLNDFHPAKDEAREGTNLPPSNGQILTERETNDVDQSPLQAGEGISNNEEIEKEEDIKEEKTKAKEDIKITEGDVNISEHQEVVKEEKVDVTDEDAAQKKKREKRRKQKERRKVAKCLSNDKDDQSSNKPVVTVEQDTTEKEQEKPGKSGQEVPKDQKTPEGAKNQEFLHREHHGKEKPKGPVEQKHDVEKKGEIPRNITQEGCPRAADETQSRPLREPKKENQAVRDYQKHEKNKQRQPGLETMDKATKVENVPQQTEMRNPDLTEVKVAAGNKDSNAKASLRKICILSLCNQWKSWGESIPVINRELCLALAHAGHRVVCLVPKASEKDKEEARRGNVELIQCTEKPGINKDDPQLFYHDQPIPFLPNLVIGHGRVTGPAAVHHATTSSCPRLHVIHDLPKEYVKYDEVVNGKCNEEELAMSADFTTAVGTLLTERWSALINRDVFEIIPGLPELTTRNSISSPQCRCFVPAKFSSPDASGLRIALMAVNNSSKRDAERPRRSTIIVRNTDSSTTESPSEILEECDKSQVDMVERPGNNCQEAYFDIQGATVFLSPAKVDAFGVAALDAMAIGIPIVISAHSGLAFTIRKHFHKKFHCCMKERGDDDDDDADIWAMEIDKVAVKTAETFASADKLRSEWKKKFTWDMVAEQLMTVIVNSGKISSSPADQLNAVLTRHVAPSCLDLVKDLNLFDKRQKFVLFLSPEDPQQLQEAAHLGLVNWAAVFDFDRESATNGYLKNCENFLQSIGKPACRRIPQSKEDVTLPSGIPWILLQGLPEIEINIDDNLDFIQEILRLLKARHPQPMTILIIWKTAKENKNLCKALRNLLTLVRATTSWKNSVHLVILSTSELVDGTLEDIAEDWDVKIRNVDILHFFKAIYSTAMTNPLWRLDPDFSLPKRNYESTKNDIAAQILPLQLRWVDSTVEVLYASIGNTPEFGKDDASHFYRGGKISWYGLEMNHAVERESWKPLRKTIEKEIEYPGASRRRLCHERGAGGTTSARKLLYDFHLKYPCVCLKKINSQTCLAIKTIWEFCSLPVIILADVSHLPGVDNNDIDVLYENLSNEKVSCLILQVVHRNYIEENAIATEPNPKEPFSLAKTLTIDERDDFFKAYSFYSEARKSELCKLKSDIQELQIPFYYGLVAFEHQFKGLEPFVSDCLKGLNETQRKAMCFLSMTHKYATTIKELPLSALAGIFAYKPRELHSIEDVLPSDSIQLLIEDEEGWRPRHYTIATEVLCQLLTVPYEMHRGNWKSNLADIAIEFVSCMEEDVTNDILINRVCDEKTHKHFSSLVEDIPESDEIVAVFEEAIKAHPNNPFFT